MANGSDTFQETETLLPRADYERLNEEHPIYGNWFSGVWAYIYLSMANSCCCLFRRFQYSRLTRAQKICLDDLKKRAAVEYNESNQSHEDLLRRYWRFFYTDDDDFPRTSALWKKAGFQSDNPRTDFRGGGLLSLECMVYFAEMYPMKFREIVFESESCGQYPFSAGFVNVCFMIVVYLRLNRYPGKVVGGDEAASNYCLKSFVALEEGGNAFEELFCACSIKLHRTWRRLSCEGSTLMDFPEALRITKRRMISVLGNKPASVYDFKSVYLPTSGCEVGA